MKSTTDSFISSAYWTENIGFAAAIATITYMKKIMFQKTYYQRKINKENLGRKL